MDAESLLSRMRQELAPLREELVRIRELLERIERANSTSPAGSFAEAAVPLPDVRPEPPPGPLEAAKPEPEKREGGKLEAATHEAPACGRPRADVEHSRPRSESAAAARIDPDEVELFGQLLRLYPTDAAAVFYGDTRRQGRTGSCLGGTPTCRSMAR